MNVVVCLKPLQRGWVRSVSRAHFLPVTLFFIMAAGFVLSPPHAYTLLSGEVTGTIKKQFSPYYVDKDITIPKDKKCTVEAGCVFLFKEFTGIKAYGKLLVNGTPDSMVVFTSVRDRNVNTDAMLVNDSVPPAAPFDWNGLDILDQALGSSISNASFWYTVNGIYSRTKAVVIDRCYFNYTGTVEVKVDEKIFSCTPGTPLSVDLRDAEQGPVPPGPLPPAPPIGKPWHEKYRKEVKIGFITLGAAGVLTGIVFGSLAAGDFMEASNGIKVGDDTKSAWAAADTRYRKNRNIMFGSLTLGSCGGIGYLLTLNLK